MRTPSSTTWTTPSDNSHRRNTGETRKRRTEKNGEARQRSTPEGARKRNRGRYGPTAAPTENSQESFEHSHAAATITSGSPLPHAPGHVWLFGLRALRGWARWCRSAAGRRAGEGTHAAAQPSRFPEVRGARRLRRWFRRTVRNRRADGAHAPAVPLRVRHHGRRQHLRV
jgi:hypothetical protein